MPPSSPVPTLLASIYESYRLAGSIKESKRGGRQGSLS